MSAVAIESVRDPKGYSMSTIILIAIGVIFLIALASIITMISLEPHRERMRRECHKTIAKKKQ